MPTRTIRVLLALLLCSTLCWAASESLFTVLYAQISDSNMIRRVRAALAAGADVNADNGQETPLIAATRQTPVIVNDLLRAGSDPNRASGPLRRTALMEAVKHTAYHSVILLMASGANINAKDSMGLTALDILEGTNPIDRQMQKLLKSYGARHGTLDGKSIDAMLAKYGDHRDLTFNEPAVIKVGQLVDWGLSANVGGEFQGKHPYWLYEGQTETLQGIVLRIDETTCQVRVSRGYGAFKNGSVQELLRVDVQPVERSSED